ncbi:MAG: glucose-6-phosphate isomerase, partial [Novosphingobium sp.]
MSEKAKAAWDRLAALPRPTLGELFGDGGRVGALSAALDLPGGTIRFDWSKTHLDAAHLAEFVALAEAMDFAEKRAALFEGAVVNVTEGRAAEHTAQRGLGKETSVEEAAALHLRMKSLVEAIHAGALGEISSLIHIGIGGSALGPALAIDALARDLPMVEVHVVSNIDGCALEAAFARCDPATTLIALASKTFTTTETMTNA